MKALMAAAAAMALGMACAPAQAVVIGTADSAGGMPFSSNIGGYYYQQVYSAASFASPISISQLTFYNTLSPGGTTRSGPFVIYLSTTTAPVATFDTSNGTTTPWYDPATFVEVYNGELPTVADGRLDFTLSTTFDYAAAAGTNLLLTIREFSLSNSATPMQFDLDKNDGITNSRFSAYPYDWNQGLVTGFNDVASAVPEPASWAMMVAGFGLTGAALRRRRTVAVRFA